MKNIFYLFIAFSSFIFTDSHAQVEKGKFILGGLINPQITSSTNSTFGVKSNILRLSSEVRFGYFITERFNLGIDLGNQYSRYKQNNGTSKYLSLIAGPYMRYYFLNEKLGVFGEGGTGVGMNTSKHNYNGTSNDKWITNTVYAKFGPGINYFIKENIALEVLMTYQRHWQTTNVNSQFGNYQKVQSHVLDFKIGLLFLL